MVFSEARQESHPSVRPLADPLGWTYPYIRRAQDVPGVQGMYSSGTIPTAERTTGKGHNHETVRTVVPLPIFSSRLRTACASPSSILLFGVNKEVLLLPHLHRPFSSPISCYARCVCGRRAA